MNSDIEEIKSRLNIVDVLRDYIRVDKAGANFRALCPFHNEKTPSFMISEEKQIWHCFGCGKGGDIFSFVMEIEGLEFREALKILAEKAGVEIKKISRRQIEEKNKSAEILELATKFYETQLWKGAGKIKIINYLKERGLKEESIKSFRLGYAPAGWRNILEFMIKRGYKIDEIKKTGLLVEKQDSRIQNSKFKNQNSRYYDRFRDRIIFPIGDITGKIIGFSARVAPGGDESQAKYVNTPETESYHKSRVLYGIDKAKTKIRQNDFVFLVEGNMDVIACHQAGMENTVAVSGTALTEEQLNIIKRYTGKIKIGFDMDQAGELATQKSLGLCFEKELNTYVVELPEGKDAAELAKKDPQKLEMSVKNAQEAMEYLLQKSILKNDKNKATGQKAIAEEMLGYINYFSNPVERKYWLKRLSEVLETDENALTDILKKVKLKKRLENNSATSLVTEDNFFQKKKINVLIDNLVGLMLVYKDIWQEISKKEIIELLTTSDKLLEAMIREGKKADYDYDKFLTIIDDRELITQAEKRFFEKKYRMGLNNNLEEINIEDPKRESEEIIDGLKKEIKKEKLNQIAKDLKLAEDYHDREAVKYLRNQWNQILNS